MPLPLSCNEPITKSGKLEWCGERAYFRYWGIVRRQSGLTQQHSIERFGRMVKDLCLEHTRFVMIEMEPALKDGTARLQCLEFTKLTLHCESCQSFFRYESLRPTVHRAATRASESDGYHLIPNHYCPNCGACTVAVANPELDYWEIIAKQLKLPVGLTTEIHRHWMRDKTATAKFVEYVTTILEELDAE